MLRVQLDAAIGILRILMDRGYHLSLAAAVETALDSLQGVKLAADRAVVAGQVLDFVAKRLEVLWGEEFPPDLVAAVLSAGFDDAVDARRRLEALGAAKARPDFAPLAATFKRFANIQEKAQGAGSARVDPALLRDEAERHLLAELTRVEAEVARLRAARYYAAILAEVAGLKPAVDRFFDEVLVMAEEPGLRDTRLGLLRQLGTLFSGLPDFRRLQAEAPGAGPLGA